MTLLLAASVPLAVATAQSATATTTPCQQALPAFAAACTNFQTGAAKLFIHRGGGINKTHSTEDTPQQFLKTYNTLTGSVRVGSEADYYPLRDTAGPGTSDYMGIIHDPTTTRTITAASLAAQGLPSNAKVVNITQPQWENLLTTGGAHTRTMQDWLPTQCSQSPSLTMLYEDKDPISDPQNLVQTIENDGCGTGQQAWFYTSTCTKKNVQQMQAAEAALGYSNLRFGVKLVPKCTPSMTALSKFDLATLTLSDPATTASYISQLHAAGLSVGSTSTGTLNAIELFIKRGVGQPGDFLITDVNPTTLAQFFGMS